MFKSIFPLVVATLSTAVIAAPNTHIASDLLARYNNTVKTCTNSEPAFKCSGIMIRGINQANSLAHAWSLKPENKQKESFAIAYLRSDQQFSSFPRNYDSGFIIYPHLKTPAGKNTYKAYCAFPVDGGTDSRAGHGCGQSINDSSTTSQHCDKQGINTFNKWVTFFNTIMTSNDQNFVARQCAFDMTLADSGKSFDIVKQANQYIQKNAPKYYMRNNEILLHAWNENNPSALPIEAFFYIIGSPSGLSYAQKYQNDFYNQTNGETVPIVGITLPKTPQDKLIINYNAQDQAIGKKPENKAIAYNRPFTSGSRVVYTGFNGMLPDGYSFQAGKQYKLELTLPSSVELLTCTQGSFVNGVCGATQLKEYTYQSNIFTPLKSGVLYKTKLIGNKNLKVRANSSGVVKIKMTPL